MTVWVLKDGEMLPVQTGARRMRTWMLAEALTSRGHQVEWWASTFSHHRKARVRYGDATIQMDPRFRLRLLEAGEYRKNFSVRRYLHHRRLGARFAVAAARAPRPDVVVTAYPVIDLAYAALRYCQRHRVPLIVDVRDLWPDTYLLKFNSPLRPVVRMLLWADFRRAKAICAEADSLVAMSHGVLDWGRRVGARPPIGTDCVYPLGYPTRLDGRGCRCTRPPYIDGLEGRRIFTYVGAFGTTYDLLTVCDVAEQALRNGLHEAHFVFAGSGDGDAAVRARARHLPNVTMTGWLGNSDVEDLLGWSSAGLIPWSGISDAMPNKFAECLAAGLPVVASLDGEAKRLIEDRGIGRHYRAGDVQGLYSVVAELSRDPVLVDQMARRSRELFEAEFAADRIYPAFAEHVERLAGMADPISTVRS